jgi:hypothetical protein
MLYEVVLEAERIRNVICQTNDYDEAYEIFKAYGGEDPGYFIDRNEFEWDVYIEEWQSDEGEEED